MPYVDWSLKGPELVSCNCVYGCPCQFNARPTHGTCEAVSGMLIEEGHFSGRCCWTACGGSGCGPGPARSTTATAPCR